MTGGQQQAAAEALWNASGEPARMVRFDQLSEAHRAEYLRMASVVIEAARPGQELRERVEKILATVPVSTTARNLLRAALEDTR